MSKPTPEFWQIAGMALTFGLMSILVGIVGLRLTEKNLIAKRECYATMGYYLVDTETGEITCPHHYE